MVALLCFLLTLLTSPFKSKSRLEAENAALRHQAIVLQRRVSGSRPTEEWGSLVVGHGVSLGGLPLRRMYFETVDWATSNPSIKSSPWTRDAPHSGFNERGRRDVSTR